MRKSIWLTAGMVVVAVVVLMMVRFSTPEDTWRWQNNMWVRHGSPAAGPHGEAVVLYQPLDDKIIESPLTIQGEALGTWYFEASFPVELKDGNGDTIAQAVAEAKEDWMTTKFVPFEVELTFAQPNTDTGSLIFHKDNPSGDPQRGDEVIVEVRF